MSHGSDSLRSIFYALGANAAIARAKFTARFPETLWLFFEPDLEDGDA